MEIFRVIPPISLGGAVDRPSAVLQRRTRSTAVLESLLRSHGVHNFHQSLPQHQRISFSLLSPLRTAFLGDRKVFLRQGAALSCNEDRSAFLVAAVKGATTGLLDGADDGRASGFASPDDIHSLKAALLAAEARALEAEKARQDALEAMSISEAKAHEYAVTLAKTAEDAVAQLEASKKLFKSELDKMLEEKSAELSLAKQDAVNLAVNVEKVAEFAIKEATHKITVEAKLRACSADAAAAEAALKLEESISQAAADAATLVMQKANFVMNEAMVAAALAQEQASRAKESLSEQSKVLDELADAKSAAFSLQGKLALLEERLNISENSVQNLQAELVAAQMRTDAAIARVVQAEANVKESQTAAEKVALERDESMKQALETIKATVGSKEKAATLAINADLEALRAAYFAAQEAAKVKELANLRVHEALERSIAAAEATAKAWKNRSLIVEDFLHRAREEASFSLKSEELLAGGRMETLLGNDSRRWDLLAQGPRRGTPDWMKWRIEVGLQNLPPRNPLPITAPIEAALPLYLPTPEEVWSISSAKVKDDDLYTKQAVEKEALDEQRKALERALQKKTVKRFPEDQEGKQETSTGSGREIVFQGFNWESWRRKWYLELAPKAADLSKCGITTIWLPPPTESVSPQGYMPGDLYNLNSAYGTLDELKQCIEEMHRNNILVLGDAVLNHRCAQKQSTNGIWNVFGGKLAWGPEAIVKDDPNFQGRGNPSSGDFFHAAPNIDHSQDFVRKDIIGWMKWLRSEIGFDGWRLDFVRGFWGGYVKEYIESTKPAFSIGEYWDSLAYEGGQVCYNQDAHRQRIINWINATGGTSSAFDVTTKGILHSALHNEYWRLIDPQGKPPGVMGWWPSRAVTFLENHDTGSTQGHWPFPRDKLMQGYAYILTHPGTPLVFYDHFYDFGLHDQIAELIDARKRTRVHCRSPVKILHANFDGYVAQVGDNLLMKLGRLDWNPSKENKLVGTWERFLDQGADFQLWERRGLVP